jgi:nitroreductase
MSAAAAEGFLRARRSIRVYRDKPVEREKLARLIEVARYAPTGSNSQRLGWIVIGSRERVKTLAGMVVDFFRHLAASGSPLAGSYRLGDRVAAWDSGIDVISRGAPALVAAHAPKEYGLGTVDCALALTYLDLMAPSLDLGSCWGGFFMMAAAHWPPLQQALGLPEGHACHGVMMVGYPKFAYYRLPMRNPPTIQWK